MEDGGEPDGKPRTLNLEPRTLNGGMPSDKAAVKEGEWKRIMQAYEGLKHEGMTRKQAAKVLGVGLVTLWRIETQYAKREFQSKTDNCGRTSDWEYLILPRKSAKGADELTAFAAKLLEIYEATIGAGSSNMTRDRHTAKLATALTAMAEEPECPPELAARLRRGKFPICLQRFLRSVTPELENRIRGPKHFQLNGLVSRRDLTLRFPDGSRAEMPAGFKWVFDDMSVNQPFWCHVDGRLLFSRQGLYCIDHRSLRWLGKMLVARSREAYRAEDILRFLRVLFELYGKPDVIVFEKGVWASRKIRGHRITETSAVVEEEFVRPEMSKEEMDNLAFGLSALGVKVIFAHSAHGKIIETCFNHLQDIIAIKTRDFVNIGRHAGEFESGAKRLRQVRAESHRPGQLGFATMDELSDRIDSAFAHINGKQNSRGEVPDEIWAQDVGTGQIGQPDYAPGRRPLVTLEAEDYAVFLPEVRERSIEGGCVTVKVDGQQHDFRADWMAELGSGFKVWIKFDPSEPTLGAALYSRESGPNNIKGYKLGKLIGFAQWEMPAPSVDVTGPVRGCEPRPVDEFYGAGAVDQGDTIRKRQSKLVATAFSALPRPGQPAVKRSEARDGEGNVSRVESGAQPLSPSDGARETRNPKQARMRPVADPESLGWRSENLSPAAALRAATAASSYAVSEEDMNSL